MTQSKEEKQQQREFTAEDKEPKRKAMSKISEMMTLEKITIRNTKSLCVFRKKNSASYRNMAIRENEKNRQSMETNDIHREKKQTEKRLFSQ